MHMHMANNTTKETFPLIIRRAFPMMNQQDRQREAAPVVDIEAPGIKAGAGLLHSMREEVAQLLGRRNTNFPGAQPVSFARRHLDELEKQDYFLCEKSDGFRYLLYLTEDDQGGEIQYLIDRKNDYWFIPKGRLHFPIPNNVEGFHINTLVDGELVIDRLEDGSAQVKYLVFDCLVIDGNSLMGRTLDKRIAYFTERIFKPYQSLLKQYPEEIQHMHFLVEMKATQFSYNIPFTFDKILPALRHGHDGLIFTCRMTPYQHGTDQHILKWKPENENSIDFRLVLDFPLIQPDAQDIADGITKPYYDYDAIPVCHLHMYMGDDAEDEWYGTMYLELTEWEMLKGKGQPLNDRIVECYKDSQNRWRYMKFRDDKKNANHRSTVESVIESINDRVTQKDLIAASARIRTEWKRRNPDPMEKKPSMNGTNPAKRKAEEQGSGRPSPGPPGKN